ncbi:ERF family ssDNA binding protein [Microbacterium phage Kozie]|uniref:ERF family ssDNA binding protein n=1 Tax=Microbacterium phage Kozie TaxID=2885981 RepID=A0AAE8YAJ4_9CAUD|nr:ERF family ssDNA binding protein [Microbacterium phage Kozie]UDL16242.1 ERF family ssDNA binding protein [Microbacterium phage Kozie]
MTVTKTAPKAPAKTAAKAAPAPTPEEIAPEIEEHENFATALAAFQRNLPSVRKGNTAQVKSDKGSYSYDYADLTDVSEIVLPALGAVGLAWHTGLDTDEHGNVVVTWELIHGASGTGRQGRLPAGRAGANWQSLGSAITYARRYALTAATGVAPGGDDDDAQAHVTAGSAPTQQERPAAPRQAPVQAPAERLPAGLYDLAALTNVEAVRETFRKARAAGHLALLVGVPDAQGTVSEVAFGQYLTDLGTSLTPAPGEEPADDNPAASEDADARAIAEHEATLTAQAPVADDDAPEGDR